MSETASDNGKTIGIIAYLSVIGWIIALVMHNGNKTDFGAFHIRQMLGIVLVSIALMVVSSVLNSSILTWIIQLTVLAFWLLGFIGAVTGKKTLVPLLGAQFQDWFKGIV